MTSSPNTLSCSDPPITPLKAVLDVLSNEITYLDDAISTHKSIPTLVEHFTTRRDCLADAQTWLKHVVESAHQETAANDDSRIMADASKASIL